MSFIVKLEPTLTGGTDVTLVTSGMVAGRASYQFPNAGRLAGCKVSLTVSTKGGKAAPIASTGLHMEDTRVAESEACCTVSAPSVVFDTGVRYGLMDGLTSAQITESVNRYRAVVNSDEFLQAVLTGAIPA